MFYIGLLLAFSILFSRYFNSHRAGSGVRCSIWEELLKCHPFTPPANKELRLMYPRFMPNLYPLEIWLRLA